MNNESKEKANLVGGTEVEETEVYSTSEDNVIAASVQEAPPLIIWGIDPEELFFI